MARDRHPKRVRFRRNANGRAQQPLAITQRKEVWRQRKENPNRRRCVRPKSGFTRFLIRPNHCRCHCRVVSYHDSSSDFSRKGIGWERTSRNGEFPRVTNLCLTAPGDKGVLVVFRLAWMQFVVTLTNEFRCRRRLVALDRNVFSAVPAEQHCPVLCGHFLAVIHGERPQCGHLGIESPGSMWSPDRS